MLSNKQLNFSFQEKQDFIPCVLIGKSGLGKFFAFVILNLYGISYRSGLTEYNNKKKMSMPFINSPNSLHFALYRY